jgi:hypothetical protein
VINSQTKTPEEEPLPAAESFQSEVAVNTTSAARFLRIPRAELISRLAEDKLIVRVRNRHYQANPAFVRAGMASKGDLRWTPQGMRFLARAYADLRN